MNDTIQPAVGTREWAEQQARAGKRARHKSWATDDWTDFPNLYPMPSFETGWSLYEPEQPDEMAALRAEVTALAERFNRHFHMTDAREDRSTPTVEPTPNAPMTDDEGAMQALKYANRLLDSLVTRHFPERTVVPLDSVIGILTQIDSITSGLVSREQVAREMTERREKAAIEAYTTWNEIDFPGAGFAKALQVALDIMQGFK